MRREDGARAGLSWESVLRIDGLIKRAVAGDTVPYLPIEPGPMRERVRAEEAVLERMGGMAEVQPATVESPAPRVVSLPSR